MLAHREKKAVIFTALLSRGAYMVDGVAAEIVLALILTW